MFDPALSPEGPQYLSSTLSIFYAPEATISQNISQNIRKLETTRQLTSIAGVL